MKKLVLSDFHERIGGKMVIPIGDKVQKMVLVTRINKTKFEKKILGEFYFVPMLKNLN